jgi:DNA (cytosine-5)-methyltransferase 1
MRYATVCSGGEAFGEAWKRLGYSCAFHSEIEQHASSILRYRYPEVPNLGDFTQIDTDDYPPGFIQLLAGGTPCQSFSIAGLRRGMADARGNLSLQFLKLAAKLKCPWILWENVPGVLSSNGGRDFGSFLGGLAQLGYGFAYRVLDAQYFGVPQRRKRVFVVGYLGDWRAAAAVLFERHSLQGHSAPGREKGQRIADSLTVGANQCSGFPGDFVETFDRQSSGEYGTSPVASTVSARDYKSPSDLIAFTARGCGNDAVSNICPTLRSLSNINGHQSGSHGLAIAFDSTQISPNLDKSKTPAVAFKIRTGCEGGGKGYLGSEDSAFTVTTGTEQQIFAGSSVRRLTPKECERLQGWEDDWTKHGLNEKGNTYELSDTARYKIIGNGWAAPVANWIANRIKFVDNKINPS